MADQPSQPRTEERRRNRRFRFAGGVTLRPSDGSAKAVQGLLQEISEGGMSAFVGGDGISADGSIDVDMVLPTGRIRLRALVRQKSGSHYRFEFIEMTPELTQQVTDAKKKMQPFINRVMGGGKRKELNPGGEAK